MATRGERLLLLLVAALNVFGSLAHIYISSNDTLEECNQRYGGNCLTSLNEALQEGKLLVVTSCSKHESITLNHLFLYLQSNIIF